MTTKPPAPDMGEPLEIERMTRIHALLNMGVTEARAEEKGAIATERERAYFRSTKAFLEKWRKDHKNPNAMLDVPGDAWF